MARRPFVTMTAICLSVVIFIYFVSVPDSERSELKTSSAASRHGTTVADILSAKDTDHQTIIYGAPIMAPMTNETIRAELGRSAWKVFHTILAQYPEQPTSEERETLKSYIHLFSRVYPCRECAEHFQILLQQFPPQLSSREAASQWGCHVHNQVNDRLGKEQFNCQNISDKYGCGCLDDEEDKDDVNITMERQDPETGG